MAALSYPLYLGGNGAVPRLELFHRKSMHWFLRIWAALSVKKWGILLILGFLNIVQRAMHICSFHSVYVACTCIWSASPPPACTQTRLPHHPPWTVIVITSIISFWWCLLSKIIFNQPRPHRFALAAFWRQSAVCCFSLLMMNWFGNWKNQ